MQHRSQAVLVSALVILAGVAASVASQAQVFPWSARPFVGAWSGDDWGEVTIGADGSGTYTDTFHTGVGRLRVECGSDGECKGVWGESSQRFGTLRIRIERDASTITGDWSPDPQSTIGSTNGGPIVWHRR